MKGIKTIVAIAAACALCYMPAQAHAFDLLSDPAQIAAAFMTNLALHEAGHAAAGDLVGAQGVRINFLSTHGGSIFLGHTGYANISPQGRLPFQVGGPMLNNYAFEYGLADNQRGASTYNQSLMLFGCTDFLYYSLYAFYVAPHNDHYDPVAIQQETGLSKGAILGVALMQTLLNGSRALGFQNTFFPYFEVDRYYASFNVAMRF